LYPERGGFCRQIGLLLYSVGCPGPSLFVMEKDKFEKLKFHVDSQDYFGTLATVLNLLRQNDIVLDKNKTLDKIVDDLMYLQTNYRIIKK
jgi:hypothetical protein